MVKACVITGKSNAEKITVVVAFKGSASLIDWIVNLDGDLANVGIFMVSE